MLPPAAISVDLDGFRAMYRTRGWSAPPGLLDIDAVIHDALPRFVQLFGEEGISATFFVIGEDATQPGGAERLRAAARAGHEIANHSMRHLHLPSLSEREMEGEVREADAALRAVNGGKELSGFRSPAWMPTKALLALLAKLGYRYDASVFPSPWLPLWRTRAKLLRSPKAFLASPDWEWAMGARRPGPVLGSLWEVPAATVPLLRLPVWGTILHWLGPEPFRALLRLAAVRAPLSLVLHGWELVDFSLVEDKRFLAKPGIARPPEAKMAVLRSQIRWMKEHWRLTTLERLVAELHERPV